MECGLAVVGENLLSTLLDVLSEELAAPMLLEFARKEQVHAHLKKWETILFKIQAVLEDAEERQFTDRVVKIWLDELKDLAYDIEDVLDDFSTEALRQKSKEQSQSITGKIRKFVTSFLNHFTFNYKMASKIKEITARLEDVVKQKDVLGLTESVGGRRDRVLRRIPSTSLVNESLVFGRESDRDHIINELILKEEESSDGGISVIPIVGMGGLGKTTLAQLVYNDARVETFFKLRAWICVSEEFDVVRVMKTLLESLTSRACNVIDLNGLQVKVKEILSEKRFLIVLDDVWNENYNDWTVLRSPLEVGSAESKIIITTRSQRAASMMGTVSAYHLKEMSHDHCLSLFTQHALGSRNFDNYPHLKEIGEAIVKRCKGLPLAVKTLAGLLRCKIGYHEWEDILNSRIWDLPEDNGAILPALRLSYHYLPFHLKPCFAYCSLFPKDYEFEKDELVQLWIAEGFIHQLKGMKQVEGLGFEYFHELLSRSFFQQSSVSKSCYMMHDLINDLAQYVAGEVCFRLEDKISSNGKCYVSKRARHSSFIRQKYDVHKKFESFYKMKCLRTFLALPVFVSDLEGECYLTKMLFQDLLPKLRCLRVLSFSGYCISELPDSIGDLNHLRYLNLSRTRVKCLPESLCALCNLQTLNLSGCKKLTKLPQRMENLISLHYLDIADTDNLREMPLHIGNLINLKKLSKFIVAKGSGPSIRELKGLSRLQGQLSLFELQNVAVIRDVRVANLKEKRGLDELVMKWSDAFNGFQSKVDELDVLDMLEPHQNLKKLSILYYAGSKFPSWIRIPSFVNMVCLNFRDCSKITSLPSLGRLPSLKYLHIEGMTGLSFVDSEFYGATSYSDELFPSLETLTFGKMLKWENWSQPQVFEAANKNFPHLQELVMWNCPKLVEALPNSLTSLVKLSICECPQLAASFLSLPSLRELNLEQCNEQFLTKFINLTALTRLKIENISNLSYLPKDFTCLVSLEGLEVEDCSQLTSLLQEGARLENLYRLKRLAIMKCPQLLWLIDDEDELPSSLEYLEIEDCTKLEKLPNGLEKLRSLKDLSVKWCPKLRSFPNRDLPSMLKNLAILGCESLESLPKGLVHYDNGRITTCHLENLEILGCPSLSLFPPGELPAALKQLEIWDCKQLECIPERLLQNSRSLEFIRIGNCEKLKAFPQCMYSFEHLTELHVNQCPSLQSFPESGLPIRTLRTVSISNCVNLKSLPNKMHDLTSLQYLTIFGCPSVTYFPEGGFPPNVLSLSIWGCKQLKQPFAEWCLNKLTSLKDLNVGDFDIDMTSFPEDSTIPRTLVHLRVQSLPNLRFLSKGLQDLVFLEGLDVWDCPKLQFLPKDGLPIMLGVLHIRNCPLLENQCLDEKDWILRWTAKTEVPIPPTVQPGKTLCCLNNSSERERCKVYLMNMLMRRFSH
ncbi:LRR and NB-ARC domains-containing disease resistance protein, putative isoform 3 [Theobroma cacao]|uniref:LRR and NB-ARC domains-containing disease resistance protein, putative isoform 3 n=1 Tax=Theobroma cacao TaxID=3641 RepID=A0A061DV74_THECC|nr:LRR and NB-ARC domains-containing disease resistance protein, putative isoform 3 [Theobroma cacao]